MASKAKSLLQTLRSFIKKPWEITGPCADPEYRSAIPAALEYRPCAPASSPIMAVVPTSDPDTVFDIKYFPRDQRRNRPPLRRTILRKPDVERLMKAKTFDQGGFPRVFLVKAVEEDGNARGGGYQKWQVWFYLFEEIPVSSGVLCASFCAIPIFRFVV